MISIHNSIVIRFVSDSNGKFLDPILAISLGSTKEELNGILNKILKNGKKEFFWLV